MFTKIIELDDYFPKTGEPTLRVIARSEKGRWYTERPGSSEKTASEAFDYIKTVTPREGCTIVLVNAFGAYEYYDDNRNGDAFPERTYRVGERATCGHPGCQPRNLEGWISPDEVVTQHYKTFETRGGIYKHHVNKDPRKSLGRIEKAFWNSSMHRSELLLEIRNRLDPELVGKINAGEFPAVSMGCNVRWDVCAKCGHRAPTRKDYCEHLRSAMRQIDPATGIRNCALNPSPSFFDISFVWRPADRTGFMLKKVAEDAYVIRTGASLGEKVADYEAKRAAVNKVSDIQKEIAGDIEAVRTAPDIQAIRQYRQTVPLKAPVSATEAQVADLAGLPFDALLSTLASKNASLTASEFARVFLRKTAGVIPSARLLDRMVTLQPSVLSIMGRYPKLAEELGAYVTIDPRRPSAEVEAKLASMDDWLKQRVNQTVDPPLGPGYLTSAQEPPRTDLLSMTDPNTGHRYTTTRGAAMRANHEDMKGLVGTTVGLSALYGLGLYGLGGVNPVASTLGGIGLGAVTAPHVLRAARPYRNPAYLTDQGVRVSGGTEFKLASVLAKFASDYAERLPAQCHSGNMAAEMRRRTRISDLADDHFERWEKQAEDSTEPPTLSLDDFSGALGALLLS
jgi:hypothetical protein